MLNLSDNELDRLSREAASQHDPGDLLGPQAWERLEVRLDKELGRAGPDVPRGFRGIRRLPFQYAPVILLIVGVSYYFVKQVKGRKAENSGSPPLTVVKTPQQPGQPTSDSSLKNPGYSDKSTSTPYHQDQSQNIDPAATATGVSSGSKTPAPGASRGSTTKPSGSNDLKGASGTSSLTASGTSAGTSPVTSSLTPSLTTSGISPEATSGTSHRLHNSRLSGENTVAHNNSAHNRRRHVNTSGNGKTSEDATGQNPSGTDFTTGSTPQSTLSEPSGPERAFIQRPRNLPRNRLSISDSALRAIAVQTPTNPDKKSGPSLRVDRTLTFGLQMAPDFSSVNALAGDKAGSSFGLTVDYQFANRWRIGTGLFYSKKNYTARASDYHVPDGPWPGGYYWSIGITKPVDFVKGSMTMLEIPLNLRYDFSVTGNTVFFASGGLSTYLFGTENCNYFYFNTFMGREMYKGFKYDNKPSIFSTANLSFGVETGISNDLSIMLAPYMKLPVSDLGFGKIRMSSVGINVAIRYSPVISRKRQH